MACRYGIYTPKFTSNRERQQNNCRKGLTFMIRKAKNSPYKLQLNIIGKKKKVTTKQNEKKLQQNRMNPFL